ncbi:MAG: C25 family cysteine peptidase [Euryarchaeota archaeon]|nr:C25 family cysteine peptidase [Euryarchaeota archaeon]
MKTTVSKKLMIAAIVLPFVGLAFEPMTAGTPSSIQVSIFVKNPSQMNVDVYKLLIITPSIFKNALQPLVVHKNAMGLSTNLVTLDEIYYQMYWHGRDNAEKVKYFIKSAMEEWGVRYVLLVGGRSSQFQPTWYCPVRYVSMVDDWDVEYLSDLYFADIYDAGRNFSSWDSDNDGIYGEWYQGETAQDTNIDLIPDVAVGRFPCRSEKEVKIMVQKVITYETTILNQPWFTTMLVAAGDTYPESQNAKWTGYEGEYYGDRAIENMSGFTSTRLYTSDGSFANKKDVIREFRNGWGFVYLVGHGSPKQWGNNAPNGTQFIQGPNSNDMWLFRNKDKLPVCVVSGCHNSQFDVCLRRMFNASALWKQEGIPECWSERILREPTGGAIAALGCTALGYTKEDKTSFKGGINELEGAFFRAYGQDLVTVLGDTWAAAITWYTQTYPVDWNSSAWGDSWIDTKVMQSWVLLGNPSLKIGGYPL